MKDCVALASALRDPAQTALFNDWPSLVASIPTDLTCMRHPLGFLHIELSPVAELHAGERLRLHYWPKPGVNADELGALHDHVWSLTSVVAAGVLLDRTFAAVSSPSGEFIGRRVHYGATENRFVTEGRFNRVQERELRVESDSVYRIPSRHVHETEVVNAPAVTFVLSQDDADADMLGPLVLHSGDSRAVGTAIREPFDCRLALSLVAERVRADADRT